jgi:hypothetical protein
MDHCTDSSFAGEIEVRGKSQAVVGRAMHQKSNSAGPQGWCSDVTDAEIERVSAAAKRNRWGHRDATMILVG